MGLDNGIIVIKDEVSKKITELYDMDINTAYNLEFGYYEICYWRKCYGLRSEIIEILGEEFKDSGDTLLSVEEVVLIRNLLKNKNKYNWADSIWLWEEIKDYYIDQSIESLNVLIQIMKENKDIKVYFYDSY